MTWYQKLEARLGIKPKPEHIVVWHKPGEERPRVLYAGNRRNACRRFLAANTRDNIPFEQLLILSQSAEDFYQEIERNSS